MPIPITLEEQFSKMSTKDYNNTTSNNKDAEVVGVVGGATVVPTDDVNDDPAAYITPIKKKVVIATNPTHTETAIENGALGFPSLVSPETVGGGSPPPSSSSSSPTTMLLSATTNKTTTTGSGASGSPTKMMKLQKTVQKLREERGELLPEPLLKENPSRFVIFPIQDNDVRSMTFPNHTRCFVPLFVCLVGLQHY